MEKLRDFVSRNNPNRTKKRDLWEKVVAAWGRFTMSQIYEGEEEGAFSAEEFIEENPWSDWCEAFDQWRLCGEKPPKSGKKLSLIWSELRPMANMTSAALKVANKTSKELDTTKKELMECEKRVVKLNAEVSEAEEIQKEMLKSIVEFQSQLRQKEDTMQGGWKEFTKLRNKVLDLENQLKEQKKSVWLYEGEREELERRLARFKSDYDEASKTVIIFGGAPLSRESQGGTRWLPLPEIDREITLTLCEVMEVADRMGPVAAENVIEWLYRCDVEKKMEGWTNRDVTRVLHKCMDGNLFSALPEEVQMGRAQWLTICLRVVNVLIPTEDVQEMLKCERKRDTESAVQYFNRMWMLYRIVCQRENVSRDDGDYRKLIWKGLDPLMKSFSVNHIHNYAEFENVVRLWEYFNREDTEEEEEEEEEYEHWSVKAKWPGVGCPSRGNIWRRLEAYEDPRETVNNSPYWKLVVRLSKFEDLETRRPLSCCHQCR